MINTKIRYTKDKAGFQLTVITTEVKTKIIQKIYEWTRKDGTIDIIKVTLNHEEIEGPKQLKKQWLLKALYRDVIKKTFYKRPNPINFL